MPDKEKSFLTKHPETEMDYWAAIESLGGFVWRMNHDLGHGRIKDPTGGIDEDIVKAQRTSVQLVEELWEKFGVVEPKNCPQLTLPERMAGKKPPPAPFGMEYYWDWYERVKMFTYDIMYENDICSACPYSTGNNGHGIDCKLFPGALNRLGPEHIGCGMINELSRWDDSFTFSLDEFLTKVEEEHGPDAKRRFSVKLAALKMILSKKELS